MPRSKGSSLSKQISDLRGITGALDKGTTGRQPPRQAPSRRGDVIGGGYERKPTPAPRPRKPMPDIREPVAGIGPLPKRGKRNRIQR